MSSSALLTTIAHIGALISTINNGRRVGVGGRLLNANILQADSECFVAVECMLDDGRQVIHREVVADNAQIDWDLPTRSWSTTADGAGREIHGVTEAVQSVRTRKAKKLPELQLCVLQAVPEAGMSPILHVLPSDQEQAEAKGAGRNVERDGGVYWVGGHSIAARVAPMTAAAIGEDIFTPLLSG